MKELLNVNRRGFLKESALGVLGTMAVPAIITSCASSNTGEKLKEVEVPELLNKAVEGKPLKAGLVGCGGRGTGAALNFLAAGDGLQITALGDIFEDKMATCRKTLQENGVTIADDHCFIGFDAYQKVINSGIDLVLLCTPPVFRPIHFDYVVEKGIHCFMEKPCAVDPVGVRQVIAAAKRASTKGICIITGTIRRSERNCIETYRRVAGGAIGQLVSAHVTRQGSGLWFVKRKPGMTDLEYMLRNWVNFCWTSGDFIVEQFIHEIDLMNWFLGDITPVRAEANGGRHRRNTGDMYDFISVEYLYENGMRAHCTSRQINGCDNLNGVYVYGTKGYTNCRDKIFNLDGTVAWEYPYPAKDAPDQSMAVLDPFVQEHIRLVSAIRSNQPLNDVEVHAHSVLITIMGRESAYTGRFVKWDDMVSSTMKLGPETFKFGPVPGIPEQFPVPGKPLES